MLGRGVMDWGGGAGFASVLCWQYMQVDLRLQTSV